MLNEINIYISISNKIIYTINIFYFIKKTLIKNMLFV